MGLLKKLDADSIQSSETSAESATGATDSKHLKRVASVTSSDSRRPLRDLKPPESLRSKTPPSMFGRQILSQRTTGPAVLFGTSDRATTEKQYFSEELAKCRSGLNGPGPVYQVKTSCIGKQVISQNGTAPEVTFGASCRFPNQKYGEGNPGPGTYTTLSGFGPQVLSYQKSPWCADFSRSTREQQNRIYMSAEFDKGKYGMGSPGPTICDDTSSLGNQAIGPFKSAPKVCFGFEKRFKHSFTSTNVSPEVGKHASTSAIGKQLESKKKSLPAYSFSQCNRDQRAKVFISAEHDRDHYGKESPGPGCTLKAFPELSEMQVDSRKASCNVPRFGRARRFKEYWNDNPGPGNYNC